jgi:exodeoxyribonuclease III
MKIATWNINSVRARLPIVFDFLSKNEPDVLLLQEIKCQTDDFPYLAFKAQGYEAVVIGQKSYNGVAILSKQTATVTQTSLPGDPNDLEARYVEAIVDGVQVASLYLPNGNPINSEKFDRKIAWMGRLHSHIKTLLVSERPVVLGGDFNVIPEDQDVFDPVLWKDDALFHAEVRKKYRDFQRLGVTDAFRTLYPVKKKAYTFWDYQAAAWPRDNGLRIDHFLLSPEASDRLVDCCIDKTPRGLEKASDHTPVILTLSTAPNLSVGSEI